MVWVAEASATGLLVTPHPGPAQPDPLTARCPSSTLGFMETPVMAPCTYLDPLFRGRPADTLTLTCPSQLPCSPSAHLDLFSSPRTIAYYSPAARDLVSRTPEATAWPPPLPSLLAEAGLSAHPLADSACLSCGTARPPAVPSCPFQ